MQLNEQKLLENLYVSSSCNGVSNFSINPFENQRCGDGYAVMNQIIYLFP